VNLYLGWRTLITLRVTNSTLTIGGIFFDPLAEALYIFLHQANISRAANSRFDNPRQSLVYRFWLRLLRQSRNNFRKIQKIGS
jgi:hypothetical protein